MNLTQRQNNAPVKGPFIQRFALTLLRRRRIGQMMRYSFRQLQGWFTAGVVGVVLNSRREILIVEHVFHPEWPWGLPGGWLGRGEAPRDGLQRELREETGLSVAILRPLLIENGFYFRTHLDISFLCIAENEVQSLSSELIDYRWVKPEELPEMIPFHSASIAAALAPGNDGSLSE
jgi:8-oxo-dGTP diphosphatase